uniref:Uncharacterized protein n=1 Tax=Rhizophora mucronata TaxID=61149 RepID=A0A2P2JCL5_RHIMU
MSLKWLFSFFDLLFIFHLMELLYWSHIASGFLVLLLCLLKHNLNLDLQGADNSNIGADRLDITDIYNGLGDLEHLEGLGQGGDDITSYHYANYGMNNVFQGDNLHYLELMDLDVPLNCSIGSDHYKQIDMGCVSSDNYYKGSEQSYYPANLWDSPQFVAGSSQSSVLNERPQPFEDQTNLFSL